MSMPRPSNPDAPCFVYVLLGVSRAVTYVGWTKNLEQRLARHNKGSGARTTRGSQWRLVYAEKHATRGEALSREHALKQDRKFRALLRGL
jgi:putative endonuclease